MNLFKTILILVILGIRLSVQAQIESDVKYGADENQPQELFKAPQPKRGIYQNFTELKNNTPSITSDFKEISSSNGPVITYQIRGGEKDKRIKDAYGFSDGQSVYLNARNYGSGNYYVKIDLVGRYLFFRDSGGGGIGLGGAAIAIGPVYLGNGNGYNNRITPYILDTQNGNIESLSAKRLKVILARDAQLLQAYEQEKHKNDANTLGEYIRRYNEKYSD